MTFSYIVPGVITRSTRSQNFYNIPSHTAYSSHTALDRFKENPFIPIITINKKIIKLKTLWLAQMLTTRRLKMYK